MEVFMHKSILEYVILWKMYTQAPIIFPSFLTVKRSFRNENEIQLCSLLKATSPP